MKNSGREMVTVAEFPAYCRAKGLKCTAQRAAVYAAICGSREHPSVDVTWEIVSKTMPMITRTSVYRILNEFADIGLVTRMDTFTAARYDTCVTPHVHFICERCGAVTDYPFPKDVILPGKLPGVVHHTELRLTGICARCSACG